MKGRYIVNTVKLEGKEYTQKEFNEKFGLIGMTQLKNFMDKSLLEKSYNQFKKSMHTDYWIDLSILMAYCNQKSITVD